MNNELQKLCEQIIKWSIFERVNLFIIFVILGYVFYYCIKKCRKIMEEDSDWIVGYIFSIIGFGISIIMVIYNFLDVVKAILSPKLFLSQIILV